MFWGAEGAGAHWPGGDAALPAVIALIGASALGQVVLLRRRAVAALAGQAGLAA
jgi:uncharacterized membrane protein